MARTVDIKKVRAAMKKSRDEGRAAVKALIFVMPDLKGPGGNAYALLGQAQALMKKAGVPEGIQADFHSGYKDGTYENLLQTIADWFTVVVPVTTYVPLEGDILAHVPDDLDEDRSDEDDEEGEEPDE